MGLEKIENNTKQPLISIVIPVCNVEKFLPECLESVMEQTLKEIEIICVEDCSRDNSTEILRTYAERDKRIRTIFHKENLSTSQARKDGVGISRGKYVMFVDGDDRLAPEACEIAYKAIEKYQTDMVQFDTEIVNCAGVPEERIAMNQKLLKPCLEHLEADNLVIVCWKEKIFGFSLWNKIFNGDICRKAFCEVEDGSFPKAQDLYAFFLIASHSRTYMGIEETLYYYNFGVGVTGSNFIPLQKFDILLTEKRIWECLKRYTQNAGEEIQEIVKGIYDHFLVDCIGRWQHNLQPEDVSEGFRHLVDVWGIQEVISKLAAKNWFNRTEIAEKMAEVDYFTHEKRSIHKHKTVAVYYRSIKNGGAQRVVALLCNMWANMRDEERNRIYKVVLITDEELEVKSPETEYDLDSLVYRAYLPPHDKAVRALYKARCEAWGRIIREYDIDIVVTGMWVSPCTLWDMLSVKGQPSKPAFIIHAHTFCCVPYRFQSDICTELMYEYQICDGTVNLSPADQRYARCFVSHSKYIPNPLTFSVEEAEVTKREKNTLVWVGRISKEKQPLDAVYMMNYIVRRLPDAKLYLVGDGDKKIIEEIESTIEQLGLQKNVILTGFTLEVDAFYKKASVLIGTSEFEGFPLTFVEALSHAVPIVAYDLPWLTLIREGDGIVTVKQKRFDLLAEKVLELLENTEKAQELGEAGRKYIEVLKKEDIAGEWKEFFNYLALENEGESEKNSDELEVILIKYLTLYAKVGKEEKAGVLNKRIEKLTEENKEKALQIKKLKQQNKMIKKSLTFKAGKVLLYFPKKCKSFLKKILGL